MRSTSPGLWDKAVLESRLKDNLVFSKYHDGASSDGGVIAASFNGIAAEVGGEILRMGGNAMDAALATAFTQIVFGGGDYVSYAGIFGMTYFSVKDNQAYSVDATWNVPMHETDPLSIPGMTEPGNGRTALVPGFMAGAQACCERFGSMPLADLIEPAVFFCEHGFNITKLGDIVAMKRSVLSRFPETWESFVKENGEPYQAGDLFKQPKVAAFLRKIQDQGADYMYRGEWARKFVDTVQREGGVITLEDLANYRVDIREANETEIFGTQAYSTVYPISGGDGVLAILKALEKGNVAAMGHLSSNGKALLRFSQGLRYYDAWNRHFMFKRVSDDFAANRSWLGDDFDFGNLFAERNFELYWRAIDEGRFKPPYMTTPASKHSDCITVADREGNVLAMTHSANQVFFGMTGISVDGIMITDSGALNQEPMAKAGPGNRVETPLAPLIFMTGGKPRLALSGIGVGLIEKSVCLAHNVLVDGMDVVSAQNAPWIMAPDGFAERMSLPVDAAIYVDESDFRPEVLAEARALGLQVKDYHDASIKMDVQGGPSLDGFVAALEIKDGRKTAVPVNWTNSKAVAETADAARGNLSMANLTFMSAEHVAAMNQLLAASPQIKAAAARLPREILWVARLWDDVHDKEIWWQSWYSPTRGAGLALGPPARRPDVQFASNYWDMIAATKARVDGVEGTAPAQTLEIGDPDFMGQIAEIYQLCWSVAMMDHIDYPTRPAPRKA